MSGHACAPFTLPAGVSLHRPPLPRCVRPEDVAVLDEAERDRADRYLREEDRLRFVTARAALRRLLARRLGGEPSTVVLAEQGRGKPVLAVPMRSVTPGWPEPLPAPSPVHFSVSHAGPHVVVAVADRPVGVDVDVIRPGTWDRQMASLVLSAEELRWLDAATDADRAFFRCWTRKEAVAKWHGCGLVDELRALTVTPVTAPGSPTVVDGELAPGVLVALAVSPA